MNSNPPEKSLSDLLSTRIEEKIIELTDNIDLVVFYGVNNANMRLLKNLFPKVKIVARNNIIKIQGTEVDINNLERIFGMLCWRFRAVRCGPG